MIDPGEARKYHMNFGLPWREGSLTGPRCAHRLTRDTVTALAGSIPAGPLA